LVRPGDPRFFGNGAGNAWIAGNKPDGVGDPDG